MPKDVHSLAWKPIRNNAVQLLPEDLFETRPLAQ